MAAQPRYPEVLRSLVNHRRPCGLHIPIDLTGVPTIPDDASKFIFGKPHDPKKLPRGFAKRTNRMIREACEEINRRKFAAIPAYVPPVEEADDYDD